MKINSVRNKYHLSWLVTFIMFFVLTPVRAETIADGVRLTPLTNDGRSMAASWAYHGTRIAFVRDVSKTQRQLLIMNSDGIGEKAVTPIGNPFFVEWSWSGEKLSYGFTNTRSGESQGGLFVYDAVSDKTIPVSAPYTERVMDEDEGPLWSADDQYVGYMVEPGASRSSEIWIGEVRTGRSWRLLPNRGEGEEITWSPSVPPKLALRTEVGGGADDIATVNPDSRYFVLLTNIGGQSLEAENPQWSPTGEWVAFMYNIDMTQNERNNERTDCWVARPDASEARNLTNATSIVTEKQLRLYSSLWSWDGRWILGKGYRYNNQGRGISTFYLIDPVNGGYEPILTSVPEKTHEIDSFQSAKWSYDSSQIAVLIKRRVVKNWENDPQYENTRWILGLYNVREKKLDEILFYSEEHDRKRILGAADRDTMADISWSPDNRSILLTIASIVSKEDNILQSDVYRLDLPDRFVDTSAPQHIGPIMGRAGEAPEQLSEPVAPDQTVATQSSQVPAEVQAGQTGIITEVVRLLHMTVEEAISSLPSEYSQYFSKNLSRNIILFKGPPEVLAELRGDLRLIDTPSPHILVDLMAVELSDEANRNLGLDWTYAEGRFAFFQPTGNAIRNLNPDERLNGLITYPGVGQSFYQGVGKLPREFFVRLNTLVKDGEATILANPRTVSMSGKESVIQIRKTVNFFFQEGFDDAGRPIVKKSDISADTEGRITPTLLADGRIHLVVDVGVGTFTFTQDAGLPEQTSRKSTTEVTVGEGETIVIGGLRLQVENRITVKVPILGYIPLIKPLFTRVETDIKHSVLTIFITPQVMKADNPVPAWPRLNIEDHKLVPIMDETPRTKTKVSLSGSSSNGKRERKGWIRRWLGFLGL